MKYTLVIRSSDRVAGSPSRFQAPIDFYFDKKYRLWEASLIHCTLFKADAQGAVDKLLEVRTSWSQPNSYDSRDKGNNRLVAIVKAHDLSSGVDGDNQGSYGIEAIPVMISTPNSNIVNISIVESGTDAWPTGVTESESIMVFSITPITQDEEE